jgi:uncharacterized damage-inducible protein DinB
MAEPMTSFRQGMKTVLAESHQEMRQVIEGLDADALNWVPGPEMNSIAVLITHSLGAEHSLLTTALGDPVDRDRDAEFRARASSAEELNALIDRIDHLMPELIDRLAPEDLEQERSRPNDRLGRTKPGMWWLLHAVEHNREHLGQMFMTRQMYEQRAASG